MKEKRKLSLTNCAAVFQQLFLGLGFMAIGVMLLLSSKTVAQVVRVEKLSSLGFGNCNYRVTYQYRLRDGSPHRETRLEEDRCTSPSYQVGMQITVSYSSRSGGITMAGDLLGDSLPVTAAFALVLGAAILTWPLLTVYILRVVALLKEKWRRPH
ncbi:MAG: hypothetical protein JXA21_28705 [Anaerolineae bacterium]|nr:hypothetical protein [Anaerolineae bacterium]